MAEAPLARLQRLSDAAGLLEVEQSTSYGAPCLRAGGKVFVSVKDATTGVHYCSLDQKEFLLEVAPQIYFQNDHFRGWPAVMVHLDVITDDELRHRLVEAWRYRVPKALAKRYDAP